MPLHVNVQPSFPGLPSTGVLASLTLAVTGDGLVTVGWSVTDLQSLEERALGCLAPQTCEEGRSDATALLAELWEAAAIVLDLPPFG